MRDIVIAACGLAIVVLLAVIVYENYQRFHKPLLTTRYQAVTLVNGDVFYGRIDHLGSDHPVLRNAFSIHTEMDPQTQQAKHVIVRRRDNLTGADHIIFAATAIASVEPVQADSDIDRLIKEAVPPQQGRARGENPRSCDSVGACSAPASEEAPSFEKMEPS